MKPQTLHKLLERQMARNLAGEIPEALWKFIAEVNEVYFAADEDRSMLERALDITSAEMMELYENLKADLQKRLAIERELSDAQAKVFASQKHEALGQLAGNIAHDFNNILAIIKGFAELLEQELKETPKYDADLQEIILAAERGRGLTGQILAYAKHQQFDLRTMNVNQVIQKYSTMLGAALGAGIELKLKLAAEEATVTIDETYFSQILLNLTVNARDAMGGQGEFSIKTSCISGSQFGLTEGFAGALIHRHSVEAGVERDFICVEFSDTGTGIPEALIPRIFEPYYTTKEAGKGTGLGLAVVYGIVKQLQGYIFCSSRLNEGTTFCVLLPATAADEESKQTELGAPAHSADIDPAHITVLVVDDEAALRDSIAQRLQNDRFTVMQAENGYAALSCVRQHPGEIDLILTDIVMPGMTGLEMAREVRRLQPDMRILFMSGYAGSTLSHSWLEERSALLEKPFSYSDLLTSVYGIMRPVGEFKLLN